MPFDSTTYGNPNRGTSEQSLDQWNQAFRQSPIYQQFMQRHGLPTDGRVQLSREQQSALEAELRASGFDIPSGMHIDQGGNLNQKNRLGRNVAIGAGIAGGALTGLGLAGMGPFSGLGGGAAASASVPGAVGAAEAPLGVGTVTGGALASSPFGSLAPYAGGAAINTPFAGSPVPDAADLFKAPAPRTGGGDSSRGMGGMDLRDWLSLATGATGLIGGAVAGRNNRNSLNPNTTTTDPNLQRILQTMQGRLDKSEPLVDSIMAMANGLLPTRYQRGGGGTP